MSDLLDLLAPDSIEPLVGWRYWRAEGGWLASLSRFKTWPPGAALEARCDLPENEAHPEPPPGINCPCGLYAAVDLPTLQDLAHPDLSQPLVVGEVALWGRVIPAARGFRAQFGIPRHLWLVKESLPPQEPLGWPGDLPSTLARTYQVPVELCAADWAVSPEAHDLWPSAQAERVERLAAHAFRDRWERLAAAKAAGEEAYRQELAAFTRTSEQRSRATNPGPAMGTREAYWERLGPVPR
ncbi:MAG TPA: hypothetical protein VFW71_00875 [Actinomycetota bacterium]|nr:hypothetical protein [Actinomycetota bacterium]